MLFTTMNMPIKHLFILLCYFSHSTFMDEESGLRIDLFSLKITFCNVY